MLWWKKSIKSQNKAAQIFEVVMIVGLQRIMTLKFWVEKEGLAIILCKTNCIFNSVVVRLAMIYTLIVGTNLCTIWLPSWHLRPIVSWDHVGDYIGLKMMMKGNGRNFAIWKMDGYWETIMYFYTEFNRV